jgi:hypothetical protein
MKSKKKLIIDDNVEYIPATPQYKPAPKRRGCLFRIFSSFMWMFILITLTFFALTFGRQWYDSLLARLELNKSVHKDESVIETGVTAQVKPTVTLVYQNKDGKKIRVIADAEEYSSFVNQQVAYLENEKASLIEIKNQELNKELVKIFDRMKTRVDRFADWYFSYSTTYKILWEATTSAAKHTFSAEAISTSDAVSLDVEKYLHKNYTNIVLRPEITDPKLQFAYRFTLKQIHDHYVNVLTKMNKNFQVFVSKYTNHLDMPVTDNTVLTLDWKSQMQKFNVAEYEKGPKEAAVGGALAAGGAVAAKAIGTASAGKGATAVAGAASQGVFAKLSAPFVSKAILAGGAGAAGTLAGPVGTVVGALGGLGIDYLINEGVELTQRESFVNDVTDALTTTQKEWEQQIQDSLDKAIDIWMNDTIQLLPRYEA